MLSFAAISEVAISATSGAPPGVVFLSGLSVTATGGVLKPEIAVTLTGQSCTASQGNVGTIIPLLVPMEVTASSGTLTSLIAVVPTGQSVTASPGTLTPNVSVALTGHSCTASSGQFMPRLSGTTLTVSPGTITPTVSVVLTGHALSIKSTYPGFELNDSTHAVVGLLGKTPAISQGTATPAIAAGTNVTTFTPSPAVTTNTSSTQAFNYAIAHVRHQAPYVAGKYWLVGEQEDGSASDWQTCIISPPSRDAYVYALPDTRAFSFSVVPNWGFGGYAIADLNPKFNGNAFQTFTDSNLQYSGVPRKWGLGVLFGVGSQGNMAQLRCRTEDRFLTYPNRTRYLVWEEIRDESGYANGFANDKGVELAHDIDCSRFESSAAAEDGPVNHALGVVPLRPTRVPLRGRTDSGTLKVTNALIFHPSLWNDGTNDHWVPTYTKVSKDLNPSPVIQKITNDVQLRSWTGVSRLLVMQDTLVTTHSGYGDVAYLTYLSSTFATPRTPAYVGVIVMDLETQEVFAHTVKALAAVSTPLTTENLVYQEEFPHRAVSEAIKIADGRSFTQFAIRGFVVNLAWTAGTHRNPTITPKDGPSTGTICTGADFLETRGNTVYHVMMRGNSGTPTAFRTVYNDATSTSASWTVPGSDLWSWSLTFSASSKATQFYCGSHKGKQTWFAETVYDDSSGALNYLGNSNQRSGEAWIDFWSGQNAILSVEAQGQVGFVDPVITDCGISVQLTGHGLTVYQSNGLISGENKTVALTGHQINANYTCPNGVSNVSVPLVGYDMECSPGRMRLIGDPVDVKLTGAHICAQMNTPSTLPPGTVQLSGFGLTASGGALTPHITVALTGFGMTCSPGDLGTAWFTGLEITASGGTLKPAISVGLMGQAATAASGTMVANPGATLPGQSATASVGTLVPHVTVALSGHSMTASAGTITPTCGVTLGGQAATCSKGNMTPDISVRVTSTAIVMSTGTVVPLHTVNLASNALAASKGNFVVFMSRALSGQVATMQIGTMGLSYDCNFAITGVQATGYTGLLRTNLPTPPADANLFVSDDNVEELFAVASQLGT